MCLCICRFWIVYLREAHLYIFIRAIHIFHLFSFSLSLSLSILESLVISLSLSHFWTCFFYFEHFSCLVVSVLTWRTWWAREHDRWAKIFKAKKLVVPFLYCFILLTLKLANPFRPRNSFNSTLKQLRKKKFKLFIL